MGILLTFKSDPAKRRRPEAVEEALGEVLIFTGVRYERHPSTETESAAARTLPLTVGYSETRTAG